MERRNEVFETHVTVKDSATDEILNQIAAEVGGKVTKIVLARGQSPVQPMITFFGGGTLSDQLDAAERLTSRLKEDGCEVVRVKVEVDLDAGKEMDWLYAEQHLKILMGVSDDALVSLRRDALGIGAHVSRNARHSEGDSEFRFVTTRVWPERSVKQVYQAFNNGAFHLDRHGWTIIDDEREVVVYDSNVDLDRGWLPEGARNVGPRYEAEAPQWPAAWKLPTPFGLDRPKIFDPSVAEYSHGFRFGEGIIEDTEYRRHQKSIFDTVLREVAKSDLRDSLCARGSVLLSHYLPGEARPPGDIDWVVMPSDVEIFSAQGVGILEAMKRLLNGADFGEVSVYADAAQPDSIWTYDRVPGRRLTIPWSAEGVSGSLQMDFVFQEELWEQPDKLVLDGLDPSDYLSAASPALSLAWKLLWLTTDAWPQGKDLFDAVLLAEQYEISPRLLEAGLTDNGQKLKYDLDAKKWDIARPALRRVFDHATRSWSEAEANEQTILGLNVDWQNFVDEYPTVGGDAESWLRRLAAALFR